MDSWWGNYHMLTPQELETESNNCSTEMRLSLNWYPVMEMLKIFGGMTSSRRIQTAGQRVSYGCSTYNRHTPIAAHKY